MDTGQWLTRGTVWLALSCYAAGEVILALGRGHVPQQIARWLSAIGCGSFLAHVASAFHFYHHWSHAQAIADTARQTAEFTGWNWGGGLYLNYVFGLVWLVEVAGRCFAPTRYIQRRAWVTWSVRAFFWFMIFNGAVVFVRGPARWFGLMLCIGLAFSWWHSRTRIPVAPQPSKAA